MNLEMVKTVIVSAVVIAYAIERIVKPLVAVLEGLFASLAFRDEAKLHDSLVALLGLWPFYVSLVIGASLAWFTGLDFLPMFTVAPVVGRVLSCGVIGQGPSAVYDLTKQVKEWIGKVAA